MKTHRCPCCRRSITREIWARLPLVGYHCLPADEHGPEEHREYRNCTYRSTLIARVPPDHRSCPIAPGRAP